MKRTGTLLKKGGFTMIEVVAVLVILAVVAAVVAVQMSGTSAYDLASQLEVVKGHLRLAQSRAMGEGRPWGINFNAGGTSYYLFQGSAPATQVQLPGEDNTTVDLTAKDSSLTISTAPQTITFDSYGSPGTATITVATSGGSITITKNTGYIP